MNKFIYKILILSNKQNSIKKQLHKKSINIDKTHFSLECVEKKYSPDLIEYNLSNCIIIDYENEELPIDEIIFYNNQCEIFIINNDTNKNKSSKTASIINKKELNPQFLINEFIKHRYNTPFYNEAKLIAKKDISRFYTPGHSGGNGLKNSETGKEFHKYFGENIFKHDISVSENGLGSIMDHSLFFCECEKMIARSYGCKEAFISVHGSSNSNEILISSLLNSGDKVIIDRNAHKSIIQSIILSESNPIFIDPNYDSEFDILLPGKESDIIRIIEKNTDAKLIIFTCPSYEGVMYNLRKIIEIVHSYNIKVMVDQSWGGHMHFHYDYYPDAIMCEADYVVISFHKILTSFSMASVILVNDPDFDNIRNEFINNYFMYSGTSVFYPTISSMDISRRIMSIEGKRILTIIRIWYDHINLALLDIDNINVLDNDQIMSYYNDNEKVGIDYSKLTVSYFRTGLSKQQMIDLFKMNSIVVEKINEYSFTIILSPGTNRTMSNKLISTLKSIKKIKGKREEMMHCKNYDNMEIKMTPNEAFKTKGEWIDPENAINRISASLIVPYPPGIPFIIPGQKITQTMVNTILSLMENNNTAIHGIINKKMKVV